MVNEQWSMKDDKRTMNNEQWIVKNSIMNNKQWTMVNEQ